MFDFVWHLRGSVGLEGIANDAALDRVEWLLAKQRKPVTVRGSDHLTFEDPLWRDPLGPGWLAMGIYDRGRFWIDHGFEGRRLRYDLRSLHGMVFCLVGSIMFFIFGLADGGLLGGLKIGGLAFGWLYGMNVLLALERVPRSIRKAISEA